jgi:putative chitobiose transport system substrate-binding protein
MLKSRITSLAVTALLVAACSGAAPTPITITVTPAPVVQPTPQVITVTPAPLVQPTPQVITVTPAPVTPPPNPEAVVTNVEPNAEIGLWTFYLSPTFDDYIKGVIARFNEAYPGVKVNWEDHQGTFQDDLKNAFNAGNAPDVINLSLSEGWVSDYASQGKLLALDGVAPQAVIDQYFPNLYAHQMVNGKHYQLPFYQGYNADLINTKILTGTPIVDADGKITGYEGGAGVKVEDFPKTIDGIPALCQTIKDKTKTLCDIRLTVNDLLAEMVYEGGVDVISADAKAFTFNSTAGVDWLQMYVDMVKAGTVDLDALVAAEDRVGLDKFSSGTAAFYATGPNLIRVVRSNNPELYGFLAVVNQPVGKSGVVGKGLMGMSVKADTKFPNASIALANFFTNAASSVALSKLASVYPPNPAAYDDPFFSTPSTAIEDSARPIAKDYVAKLADIVPTIPKKADVNAIVLAHIQDALFNNVSAKDALDAAVTEANALLGQ